LLKMERVGKAVQVRGDILDIILGSNEFSYWCEI